MISSQTPFGTEELMRRLNFLDDEPWDEDEGILARFDLPEGR